MSSSKKNSKLVFLGLIVVLIAVAVWYFVHSSSANNDDGSNSDSGSPTTSPPTPSTSSGLVEQWGSCNNDADCKDPSTYKCMDSGGPNKGRCLTKDDCTYSASVDNTATKSNCLKGLVEQWGVCNNDADCKDTSQYKCLDSGGPNKGRCLTNDDCNYSASVDNTQATSKCPS